MLNVKTFGAKGDGITDDYPAIQKAANEAQFQKKPCHPAGSSAEFYFHSVLFPPGQYVLSQPVEWGGCAHLVADGSAVINPVVTAFKFTGGFMVRMDGLTFIGGTRAVDFTNGNANGARLEMQACRFQGQSSYAVSAMPFTGDYFSTHVSLRACKWFNCAGALQTQADMNTLDNCWLQWSAASAVASIPYYVRVIGGRLNVPNTMFVPVFPDGSLGHRWIGFQSFAGRNTGAGVFSWGSEFHGESGGLPIVEITGSPDVASPFQGPVIALRDSQMSPGQIAWPDDGVILLKNGLPQTVIVEGGSGLSGADFLKDMTGDSQDIFNAMAYGLDRFRIQIGACSQYPPVPPVVPKWMAPYIRNVAI